MSPAWWAVAAAGVCVVAQHRPHLVWYLWTSDTAVQCQGFSAAQEMPFTSELPWWGVMSMDVVGRMCMGEAWASFLFVLLYGVHHTLYVCWQCERGANLGSKRITCSVSSGWQALWSVLGLSKGQQQVKWKCCLCEHSTRQSCIIASVLPASLHSSFHFVIFFRAGRS